MLSLLRVVAGFGAWLPLQACLLWLLVAWLQPWADLHLSQAAVPAMVQMASWFGALAIEAALVLANVALACTYLTRRLDLRFLPQVVVLPTLLAAHGSSQLASEAPGVSKLQVTVAQAGLEAGNERGFRDYLPLAEVAREQGSQLLVLPEGAAGAQDLSKLSRIIPVLSGTHWHGHNSALHLGGDTTQLYHKRILVPFGEHLPFPGLRAISPGRRPGVIGGLGPIICFEVSVSHLAAEQVQAGAEALVVLGDVSWFAGASQQVSSQMLAMARLRAVEMGREVLLTANRGLVAHVDSKGRVSKRDCKLLTTELNLRQEPSVYALGS
jgi:apolipoprotein N-acyltransferase